MLKSSSIDGFGIIESLISIMLLTFLLVGGMSVYMYSNEHLKLMTYQRMAADLANSQMESIREGGYNATMAFQYGCPDSNPLNLTQSIGQLDALIGRCVPVISGCDSNGCKDGNNSYYKPVEVTVSWCQPGHNDSSNITIDSFIAE